MGISKTNKTYASRYKTDVSVSQTSNVGFDATTRKICSGDGADSSLSLSDDVLQVQPQNDDTTGTFLVKNPGGSNILAVDTTNSLVKTGASQVNALTLFKEMGLYDFTPASGSAYYPLVANVMHFETAYTTDSWGGTIPTTLDVSGLTAQENAIAVYWYLENDITIDSVRFLATADGNTTIDFHIMSYDIDTSSNHGDLSDGTQVAVFSEQDLTNAKIHTGTFSINTADNDAGRVLIGLLQAGSTNDISVHLNIKYHIR